MHRIITGTLAFALTLVALGLSQPAALLAARETVCAPLAAQELGLGHTQPAVRLGGSPGGVIGDRHPIGEEIPQRAWNEEQGGAARNARGPAVVSGTASATPTFL